jgi:cytochrome c oxidase cbb3-type subunit 1
MITTVVPESLVDRRLVRWHLAAGVFWLLFGLTAGFFYSLQFLQIYPFAGIESLAPGRMRLLHTQAVAYAFLFNMFMAGLNWSVPRLTGEPTASRRLGWVIFYAWQLANAANMLLLTLGPTLLRGPAVQWFGAQAIEWGETPIALDPLIVVAVVLLSIQFYTPILRCKDRTLYVSLWYFSVAFVWTALTYLMGNYIPQFVAPGASGGAIAGMFIHDLVGLSVTPLGWGLMYYFVPVILKKPIYSHALSLVGFWGLAFFYPLNGVHHFLWSPIPMDVQLGAVVATAAVELVVFSVIVNFFMTLRGNGDALRSSYPIRWFYVGMVQYFITCLQCAYQTTLEAQKVIHFSDWVVGHAHLVMFGVFAFWTIGYTVYLWPRVTGRDWWSTRIHGWHFWLTALGMVIMFLDLTAAGLVQGFLWRGLAPWEESLVYSVPFWGVRTFAGLLMIAGQVLFALNMWMTARRGAPTGEPVREPGLAAEKAVAAAS